MHCILFDYQMEINHLQSFLASVLQRPYIYIELVAEITVANVVISGMDCGLLQYSSWQRNQ